MAQVSHFMHPSVYPGGVALQHHASSASSLPRDNTSPIHSGAEHALPPSAAQKPKQKRNKPTLSCQECVERKTKCDRGRPKCSACTKRPSNCEYTAVADTIAASGGKPSKIRKTDKRSPGSSSSKCSIANITHPESDTTPPTSSQSRSKNRSKLREYTPEPRASVLLNGLTMPNSAPIHVFDIGREHPFENFWTMKGGLAEVVGVLPRKEQADLLVAKFFDAVDPLYPVIGRAEFLRDYDYFWSLTMQEKCSFDASVLALHFVIYANATQFMELGEASHEDRTASAEFYISAAHQALRLSSYWNHITTSTVQAMIKTFYFLINDDHVSDAWTCVGITVRQAQVLKLNRDPKIAAPEADGYERMRRLCMWQGIMSQDTIISLFLKLPCTSGHSDITPASFDIDFDEEPDEKEQFAVPPGGFPVPLLSKQALKLDLDFVKCLWQCAEFMQDFISKPRSLDIPLCNSPDHRRQLLGTLRAMWTSFPFPFSSHDPNRFYVDDRRLSRQLISVNVNFNHLMMLIHSATNAETGVVVDVFGTLEAAHQNMISFFAFRELRGSEVDGFWAWQHRAFETTMTIANILEAESKSATSSAGSNSTSSAQWLLMTAKQDIIQMIEVIKVSSGYFEYQTMPEKRSDTLQKILDRITIV
ncbi:MAG: hypothetical protein M1828_003194 [Chrysothrix sp. TS-e1954]|nr:MAG: hypothetical protein M1828_003194 [Chrysothrix sp. TS-e1954]